MNRDLLGRAHLSLSIFLSALVVAWAPGLAANQALAGTIIGAPEEINVKPSLPAIKPGDLGMLPPPSLSAAPGLLEKGESDISAPGAAVPAAQAPTAQAPTAQAVSAKAALAHGSEQIQDAHGSESVRAALDKLFSDGEVTADGLQAAYQDILSLRDDVWAGRLPPTEFYSRAQAVYAGRFGADWEGKVRGFLQSPASARPAALPSGPEVNFAGMTEAERKEFFLRMPKGGELHVHLTGAIPAELVMRLGEELKTDIPVTNVAKVLKMPDLSAYGVDPGTQKIKVSEMSRQLRDDTTRGLVSHPDDNFSDFLNKWGVIGPIIFNPETYPAMMRSMADYAKQQNIQYLELLVAGYPFPLEKALEAARNVEAGTGVVMRLIASLGWGWKTDDMDRGIALAGRLHDKGVVGYNMVADERISPLKHYDSFKKLREETPLSVALHAGEQPGTAHNIVNDLLLGVSRYGHATQVEENPLAMAILYASRTPVEVSLISNHLLHIMDDLSRHPLPRFLAWGVPVIPSTDDPGVFASTLADELHLAQRQFGLGYQTLKLMAINGLRHSFLDTSTKEKLTARLLERFQAFEESPLFQRHLSRK